MRVPLDRVAAVVEPPRLAHRHECLEDFGHRRPVGLQERLRGGFGRQRRGGRREGSRDGRHTLHKTLGPGLRARRPRRARGSRARRQPVQLPLGWDSAGALERVRGATTKQRAASRQEPSTRCSPHRRVLRLSEPGSYGRRGLLFGIRFGA